MEITYKNNGTISTVIADLPATLYVRLNIFSFDINMVSESADEFANDVPGEFEYRTLDTTENPLIGFTLFKKYVDKLSTETTNVNYDEIISNYVISFDTETDKLVVKEIVQASDDTMSIQKVTEYLTLNPEVAAALVAAFSVQEPI